MGRKKKHRHAPELADPTGASSLTDSSYVPRPDDGCQHRSKTHTDVMADLEQGVGSHIFCAMLLDRVEDLERQLRSLQHADRHLHVEQLLDNRQEIGLLKCMHEEQKSRFSTVTSDICELRSMVELKPGRRGFLMATAVLIWFGMCIFCVTQTLQLIAVVTSAFLVHNKM